MRDATPARREQDPGRLTWLCPEFGDDRHNPTLVSATIPARSHRHAFTEKSVDQDTGNINFHVGGIPAGTEGEHIEWATPRISLGDEVAIRIVEIDSPDPPGRTYKPELRHDEMDYPL